MCSVSSKIKFLSDMMVDQHQGRDMMIGTDLLLEGAAAGGVIGRDLESEMTGKTDMDVCHGR